MEEYQQNYQQGYPQPPVPNANYIGFVDAIKICFNKYATFNGRATRAEYWWWVLFTVLVGAVLCWNKYVSGVANLALIIPSLAVAWRRLHDIGKGGGLYFINLIPIIGQIIFIVWCCQPSEPMPNRFGPENC